MFLRQTPILILFNFVLLVIMYLLMRPAQRFPFVTNRYYRKITIFLSFVFVIFSFWGADWFHYLYLYPGIKEGDSGHIEDVYVFIAQNLSVGYLSFRFYVWGIGLILLYFMFRHLSVNMNLLILMFCAVWIIWFSYARVSMAMILSYFGLLCLIKPYRYRLLSYALGLIFICGAVFFHKTAFFAIVCVFLAWMSLKVNRYFFLTMSVVGVLAAVYFFPTLLNNFVMESITSDDGMLGMAITYGAEYMSEMTSHVGVGTKVQYLLERTPYYLLIIQCIMCLKPSIYRNIPLDVLAFMRLVMVIVFITTVFSFNMDVNTRTIYDRFLRFAAIPGTIVMAYFWEQRFYVKLTKATFYIALLGTWYSVIYSMYCSMMS